MKKIQILLGDSREELQNTIDAWTTEVVPDILSVSMAVDDKGNRYVAILYDDNTGMKI